MEKFVSAINDIVWNPALVGLLLCAGLYFSIRTRFVQVRRFRLMLRSLLAEKSGDGKGGISSFEAFCIALSSRVGTGNIVGVATAIAFGGPGAVFWMWVVAFLGASTAFVESTLSQIYKFHHPKEGYRGGPFSMMEKGLGKRWLGVLFAIITLISTGFFLVTVQANGASTAMQNGFPVSTWVTGVAMALLMAFVIIGGVQRIARVACLITPLMAAGYIVLALVVIAFHIHDVPAVLATIVKSAFGVNPVCGGIIGTTIAMGVKRGIFSNEAGQGTGAIASAAADVGHPAQQGLAQAFSVYVDTLLVCTATALMILTSGTYNILDGAGGMLVENAPELGNNYAAFTQSAVDTVFAGFGSQFVSIAMLFFSFSTILAYYFYSESSIMYLFQDRKSRWEKLCVRVLQIVLIGSIVLGAIREADVVWMLGDIGVGLMAWGTVIVILILCPKALAALKEFEAGK